MIPRLDTPLLDAVQQKPAANNPQHQAVATGKNAFSSHLARETVKVADAKETKTNVTANRAAPAADEKWRPVEGHDDYAKIIAGERKGQYVNLNRGGRKGEAFSIEEAEGKTFHVYKREGKDDLRIEVKAEDDAAKAAHTPKTAPGKGETWAPVSGTSSYADILSGTRNGYYVNISQGSSREGEAFHIVKSGGKTFHVYGDGDDAVRVEVGKTKKKDDDKKSESAAPTTTTNNTANSTDSATAGGTTATTGKPVV